MYVWSFHIRQGHFIADLFHRIIEDWKIQRKEVNSAMQKYILRQQEGLLINNLKFSENERNQSMAYNLSENSWKWSSFLCDGQMKKKKNDGQV